MGYYQLGLAVSQPKGFSDYRRGTQVGAWIATPGAIHDEIDELDSEISSLSSEIFSALPDHANQDMTEKEIAIVHWYDTVWNPFIQNWISFRDGHQHWYNNFWGSSWDQVQQFRSRLISVRQSAIDNGITVHGPAPTAPKPGPFEELWHIVKVLAWGVVIIVLGYGIFHVLHV